MMRDITEALGFIHGANLMGGHKAGLEGIKRLLSGLGDPQNKIKCVHVAGTNGKGSTSALVASVLTHAGYKTGLYTSPYIERYNERIQISGEMISDCDITRLTERVAVECKKMTSEGFPHPMEFEVGTALAFLYFAEHNCDIAVIEVGLGGRFDATNVIIPKLSVICPIGLDHTAILGDTIEKIAFEKAGIIKKSVPVVMAKQYHTEAAEVIASRAEELGCELTPALDIQNVEFSRFGCSFRDPLTERRVTVPLAGRHQISNIATALAVIKRLRQELPMGDPTIDAGLSNVEWIARCEWMDGVLIDGAHNPQGAKALAEYLSEFVGNDCVLVFAAMKDKDSREMAEILTPIAKRVVCTKAPVPRSAEAADTAALFGDMAIAIRTPADALSAARDIAKTTGGTVVVCGSLYLAGALRPVITAGH